MKLNKYKLGDLIEQRREKNNNYQYPIRGVSREGFINPKQKDADTSLYNVFYKNDFVFNPARMEINSIALNTELEKGLCSSLYEIFYIKNEDILLPEYLNLFIKRDEFARRCEFIGWGSAREYCRVGDISDIEIELPDIEIQKKYVDVYKAMSENKKIYESGLEQLQLICDVIIEKMKKDAKRVKLREIATPSDEKNYDLHCSKVKGLTVYKEFINTKADMTGVSLKNYKIVHPGDIAYVPTTNRNGDKIACGLAKEEYIVSSTYEVLKLDKNKVIPEYLFMWFERTEMDRFARYNSWGSARETINWEELGDYNIPLPELKVQKSIVNIINEKNIRNEYSKMIKDKMNKICPILIKGSLEEAKSN